MIRGPSQDRTLFAVPADDQRASDLALKDARARREAWRLHGIARTRFHREQLAHTALRLEARIIDAANAIIARANIRLARETGDLFCGSRGSKDTIPR